MADRGDVFDPELTFSLVLTARMLTDRIAEGKGIDQKIFRSDLGSVPAQCITSGNGSNGAWLIASFQQPGVSKKRGDITVQLLLVHTPRASCRRMVMLEQSAVGACIQNLSQ